MFFSVDKRGTPIIYFAFSEAEKRLLNESTKTQLLVQFISLWFFSLPTSIRRFPTPIWEFFELQANFLPQNPPSPPQTLPPLTFQPLQNLLNFPTSRMQQLLTQSTFINLYRSQPIPQPYQGST